MTTLLRNLWNDDQGQDLIEYTLLMAFVALASAALFINAGSSVCKIWSTANSQLAAAATSAAS
jgi:Flp pilus assembly pilin Flp